MISAVIEIVEIVFDFQLTLLVLTSWCWQVGVDKLQFVSNSIRRECAEGKTDSVLRAILKPNAVQESRGF